MTENLRGPFAVTCPVCYARPTQPCRHGDDVMERPHVLRVSASERLVDTPPVDTEPDTALPTITPALLRHVGEWVTDHIEVLRPDGGDYTETEKILTALADKMEAEQQAHREAENRAETAYANYCIGAGLVARPWGSLSVQERNGWRRVVGYPTIP